MINWIRKRLDGDEEGFTLIELLVVVIIIGILAAIAIPTFLNQRQRGWDAATESELRNAAIAMESYATGNNGDYTGAQVVGDGTGTLEQEGFNLSEPFASGHFAVARADATGFCIEAAHSAQVTEVMHLDSEVGSPEDGSC